MRQKKMSLPAKIAIWAAIIALIVVGGYYLLIHNADRLVVENGAFAAADGKNWLTVREEENGEPYYLKLGTLSTPRNYTADAAFEDSDGDPLTMEYAFVGKSEKYPGSIHIAGIDASYKDMIAGLSTITLGKKTVYAAESVTAEDQVTLIYFVQTTYAQHPLQVTITMPAETSEADLTALAKTAFDAITVSQQYSPTVADFYQNFVKDAQWHYLTDGLKVTMIITLFACIIGIILGVIVAAVCSSWDKTGETMRKGPGRLLLRLFNKICRIYLTVIRGTPVMVQLLLSYLVIFTFIKDVNMTLFGAKIVIKASEIIAVIGFGINSGAYVAEIIRGGIMSIDNGQFEAGRSLGFNYMQTMWYIVVPQVFKNVLPALANEFIVLLKETSVAGYVGVVDLTKGGNIISSITYSYFMPLMAVAAIYLVIVMFFSSLVKKLERRLRNSDH